MVGQELERFVEVLVYDLDRPAFQKALKAGAGWLRLHEKPMPVGHRWGDVKL